MFEKTEIRRTKNRVMVRLCLNDGATVEGDVFLRHGERMQDLLNDERGFLPVDEGGGVVTMVGKSAIARVSTIGDTVPVEGDPYKILRIEPSASLEEVRAAWMKRLKSSHPDRLVALDLDPSIIRAARDASQQINAAYDAVIQARRGRTKASA